jgi:hypothetical protein
MFKIEGIWRNLGNIIRIKLTNIPNEQDNFRIEYTEHENLISGKIHLSRFNDSYHVTDYNDTLGSGLIEIVSDNEIIIKTSEIPESRLFKKI